MLACFSRASGRDDEVVGKVGCVDAKRDTAHGLARELPGKPRGSGAYRHIFPSHIATLSHDCKIFIFLPALYAARTVAVVFKACKADDVIF